MTMDEIVLKIKSEFSKIKSDFSSMIGLTQKLDNTTNKVASSFNKMTEGTNNVANNFKDSKTKIQEVETELKKITNEYNKLSNTMKTFTPKYGASADFQQFTRFSKKDLESAYAGSTKEYYNLVNKPNRTEEEESKLRTLGKDLGDVRKAMEFLDKIGMSYDEAKEKLKSYTSDINNYKTTLNQLRGETSQPIEQKIIIPKEPKRNLEDFGNTAKNTKFNISDLNSKLSSVQSTFSSLGKGLKNIGKSFKDFIKNLSKSTNDNIKSIKKLALGLISVRTAMSLLTKAVNAYLSFDGELQDSLTNSWNMLGSLLAPAIEFVARMFAIATNYVAQFVNALTGIDLVARANAKALETQAKANQKANQAQRGLLSMDEITNLPTESTPTPASQIKIDDTIKSFKLIDDLLNHLKNGEWHLAGEDIAHGINDLLSGINWSKIQKTAYQTSYNFADFLNGLFEVDWGKIGNTLAESVNTWIELVKGFVDKFSFIQLGVGLGDALEKFITDINWEELGQTITTGFDGLFKGVLAFLETTDWSKIGESLGDFIRNIDWGKLLSDLIKILGALLKSIGDFLGGFIASFFKDLSDDTKQSVIDIMDNIWDVIDTFIQDSLSFMNDIRDALLKPFVQLAESLKLLFQGDVVGAFKKAGKAIINALISPLNIFIDGLNLVLIPFREIIVLLAKATGKKLSLKDVRIPKVPSLDVGTPNIETEGLYHLHEGEMVVPKRYNPNSNGYESSNDNKQIIDLLISLNASMLEYAERPVQVNMNAKRVAEATYDYTQQIDKNRNKSTAVVRS